MLPAVKLLILHQIRGKVCPWLMKSLACKLLGAGRIFASISLSALPALALFCGWSVLSVAVSLVFGGSTMPGQRVKWIKQASSPSPSVI